MSEVIAYSYYTLNLSLSLPTRLDRLRHNSDDLDKKSGKKLLLVPRANFSFVIQFQQLLARRLAVVNDL